MHKIIPDRAVVIPNEAKLVFGGEIFDVYQWQQALFDDSMATFEMLKRPDTVVAICVVDDQILVIEDEQPHAGKRTSFPGGRVDSTDVSIEAAARREVLEETGYSFTQWRLIKVQQPHTKIEWFVYILLAWDTASQASPRLDAGEKIDVRKVSFEELKQMVVDKVGYLKDAQDLFTNVSNVEDLLALPEFAGKEVDR